jgi:hypothetical protein
VFSNSALVKSTLALHKPHGDITKKSFQLDGKVYKALRCSHGDEMVTSRDSEIQIMIMVQLERRKIMPAA